MKVLIAEDDAMARLLLQKAVQSLGHAVVATQDGHEAWALFQADAVDVVISDWKMPGMDGLELCRRVRAHGAVGGRYTYVIVATAFAEKEHFLAAMRDGADDYLAKPLDRVELQVRLAVAARIMALYRQLEARQAELEAVNERLFAQVHRDALTRLFNRSRLWEDLRALEARVSRYGHRYALALCDVDHFKRYNDTYGHLEGDTVLRAVATVLQTHARTGDAAYRYGGEEFVVVLPEQDLPATALAAQRLRLAVEALELPHAGNTPPGVVTLSVGIAALQPGEEKSVEGWLKEADLALYQAKQGGRNRVVIYEGRIP